MATKGTKGETGGADAASLLGRVTTALADHEAVFAIGGAVDISPLASAADQQAPLAVYWDSGEQSHARKITLPVGSDDASAETFSKLLEDCEPATFGHRAVKVLDEKYRKARKLGASQFSTSFSPYEHGIMDTVTQALVHTDYRGIRAELYNLNIYSGPSGKFKPHVDTPRSKEQMGSLVVCLPHPHQGGQLAVRHRGQEVIFDWASANEKNSSTIQWAAFFSDCEHEVLEVTDGHRLTMMYNLYWTAQGPASMADHLGALEPESLSFFSALRGLMECPQFLPKGGRVGFTCTHAYAHSSQSVAANLHKGLKGLDMVVYQALKSLVDSVEVAAVLDDKKYQSSLEDWGSGARKAGPSGELIGRLATPVLTDDYREYEVLNPETLCRRVCDDDDNRWRHESAYKRRQVTWLNHAPPANSEKELAAAFIAYGNEPGVDAYYSSAVIIAKLGPWNKGSGSRDRAAESDE